MIVNRINWLEKIEFLFSVTPLVCILGPRQCGKTTLAREYLKTLSGPVHYFDCENPQDLTSLESPLLTLSSLNGIIVIDEVQNLPEIFPILRVLADQEDFDGKFLILGSASRDLLRQSSETLAGRISYLELTPLSATEVDGLQKLWIQGGYPNAFLNSGEKSMAWRQGYITTYLEKDIPNLGINIPPRTLRRFWMMLTHYHGQIFNASEIGKSLGVAHTTARHYLDILTSTFMIRELEPWYENIGKRQVKSPKVYFRDSGIYHALLGIDNYQSILRHPKLGASWEGFALEEILRYHKVNQEEAFFWSVHNQAELDLLLFKDTRRLGFEFKYADAPRLTKSMVSVLEMLKLDELTVVYPGKKNYKLTEEIQCVGLDNFLQS